MCAGTMSFQTLNMLRRPPTSLELKIDDIYEYEKIREEQETPKEDVKQNKSMTEVLNWNPNPKTSKEIYKRVGYDPPRNQRDMHVEL